MNKCESGKCFVEVNNTDYNLASAILLRLVDEFHVTSGDLILLEFDGNSDLLKHFNRALDVAKSVITKVSNKVSENK